MHPDFAIRPVECRIHFHKVIGFGNPEGILNDVSIPIDFYDLFRRERFPVRKQDCLAKTLHGFLDSRMVLPHGGLEVLI